MLYAISDLHLSLGGKKSMEVFGGCWKGYLEKIKVRWNKTISPFDTVLLGGDLSWGKNWAEAEPDLKLLESLNGRKILISGNHDYWWSSTSRYQMGYPNLTFLKNNFVAYGEIAICGTRGWICPNDVSYTVEDEKIYFREMGRLRLSLEMARANGYKKIIVLLHFPPTNDKKDKSAFISVIKEYQEVEKVVYGHLHGEESFYKSIHGIHEDVEYFLTSADYLDFWPKKIEEL